MKLAVLGAGAWGTALAIHFSTSHAVRLWARDPAFVAELAATRDNRRYLAAFAIPQAVECTPSLSRCVDGCDAIVLSVPVASVRPVLEHCPPGATPFVLVCKGFEPGSMLLPHEVANAVCPGRPACVISGPSFAQEIARALPAAVVLASVDGGLARHLTRALNSARLRIYSSTDLVGVETAGAAKNVMAIAAGISDGLGLGLNARAALIARGLAEISRLGLRLGGRAETFMGLAGAGDLVLTCTGDLSRNRTVGLRLAQGESLEAILAALGHVAEGVSTAREIDRLAVQLGIDMPITAAVRRVLDAELTPLAAVKGLMERDPKSEF